MIGGGGYVDSAVTAMPSPLLRAGDVGPPQLWQRQRHCTMRHHGDTVSGPVDDSCKNFYHPMDPQRSSPALRLGAPKFILAGACLLIVAIVLVLITWLLITKQHDEQTDHNAGFGQAPVHWVKNKITEKVNNTSSDIFPRTTEIYKEKTTKNKNPSVACKSWPSSKYTFKDHEKIYFQYLKGYGSEQRETTVSDDSEIMQRIHFQRKLFQKRNSSRNHIKKNILTLSPLDNMNDLRKCSKKNKAGEFCNFIDDKSKIKIADAVIFRDQDLNNLPVGFHSKQIWIYNTLTPIDKNMSAIIQKIDFNLTGTYDFRSHIPMLPMYWNEKNTSQNHRESTQKNFTDETVRLVVYNNGCKDENKFYEKYNDLIKDLEGDKGEIIVEWFNSHNCTESIFNITRISDCLNQSSAECYERLKSEKKFALAFEIYNADYISERFFHPLNNSIIPIVIGSSLIKYKAVSPRDSFIYFCDFHKVDELKKRLKLLNTDKEELEKYFSWKKEGEFLPALEWYCQVCSMLHRTAAV